MGQQQLLFIVLGVIIVGIAVVVGINLFNAYSIDAKRNNVINECINLAALAQNYYLKPESLAGGGRVFTGWEIPAILDTTNNGTYSAVVNPTDVVITAIGNELVTSDTPVEVIITVYSDRYQVNVVH
ncbi:MAG: hypothetical protein WCJ01_10625 [Ignavibacteria bacterium]